MKTPFDQFRELANEVTKELTKEMKKFDMKQFDMKQFSEKKGRTGEEAELHRHIRGAEREAVEVNALIERQRQLLNELREKCAEAKTMADKRFEQTELAKAAGEEKLAERAAMESKHYGEQYRYFEQLLDQGETELDELERRALEMQLKLDGMYNRRYEYEMRENFSLLNDALDQIFGAKQEAHPFTEKVDKVDVEENEPKDVVDEATKAEEIDDFEAQLRELERRFKKSE